MAGLFAGRKLCLYFIPPSQIHKDRNQIYNFWPEDRESISQAWVRLKSLMLKCPVHELPNNILINKFYARLSLHNKDLLDASCSGSFTRIKEEAKWDLLDHIQENSEGWDMDKGKESGINYEYDCIKAFVETIDCQELRDKYDLNPQVLANYLKHFASYINAPKGKWGIYHEPFKDTCTENEIVINDCDTHAQTLESTISYKHVNFCGVYRPCAKTNNEEEYCKLDKHEKTRTWNRALNDLAEKVCAIYRFICELCYKEGHFEFQCSKFNDTISSFFDDSMIHPDLYDELELFLGCEELSRKTSLLDMSSFDMNIILQGCRLHCVDKSHNNPYL